MAGARRSHSPTIGRKTRRAATSPSTRSMPSPRRRNVRLHRRARRSRCRPRAVHRRVRGANPRRLSADPAALPLSRLVRQGRNRRGRPARRGRRDAAGLQQLSGERIQKELLRLLEAENPVPSLRAMAATGILAEIVPGGARLDRLERLVAIDTANFFAPDPVLRLAALLPDDSAVAKCARRAAATVERDRERIDVSPAQAKNSCPICRSARFTGCSTSWARRRFRDRVLLRWSDDTEGFQRDRLARPSCARRRLDAPALPAHRPRRDGCRRSRRTAVGRVLAEIEAWWIDSDFTEDQPRSPNA